MKKYLIKSYKQNVPLLKYLYHRLDPQPPNRTQHIDHRLDPQPSVKTNTIFKRFVEKVTPIKWDEAIWAEQPKSRTKSFSDFYHSDFDDWGPDVFSLRGGPAKLQETDHHARSVRHLEAGYDMTRLMLELTGTSRTKNPIFVVDLSTVMRKLADWHEHLPRVKPHYAIKCNNDEIICRMLAQAGCGFDVASQAEMEQCLAMGVGPDRLIYANPCKQPSMLQFAGKQGVRRITADNVEELKKIRGIFPEAEVVLRIAVDDSKSLCRFNSKFGCPPHEWDLMFTTATQLGLNIAGVSFHVGSGCGDLEPFVKAVASAQDAFNLARSYGFRPNLLDLGGGWPGDDGGKFTFKEVAEAVSDALNRFFPASSGIEIIGEPGRYLAHASHTYAVCVIAKRRLSQAQLADNNEIESFGARQTSEDMNIEIKDGFKKVEYNDTDCQPKVALYLNDGVYGSFNCVVFDHATVVPKILASQNSLNSNDVATKLFGPTCDSIDVVMPSTPLPQMNIGDWILFSNMGAYTRCAASRFNGQGEHDVHYVWAGMP